MIQNYHVSEELKAVIIITAQTVVDKAMEAYRQESKTELRLHAAECEARKNIDEMDAYIEDQKKASTTWREAIQHSSVDIIKLAVVAFLAWLWGKFGK